jgi:PAS domain S-box-containing protein
MKDHRSGEDRMFEVFLKSTQYLLRLQSQQDIWEHLGKFVLTHFPADWFALVERDSENNLEFRHCTLPAAAAAQYILTNEVQILVVDVLDSGFLASRILSTPSPSMTAFLPIVENGQASRVMLIGHSDAQPISTELLGIYLALAGLAGTTTERKRAEEEVRRLNAELEQRVVARTQQLETANDKLLKEIVEHKRTERRLLESEKRFREVFEHSPFGMCVYGLDMQFLQVNAAFCRMLGYCVNELLDTTWAKLTHPDDLEQSVQKIEHLLKNPGGCVELEKRYIHRSGKEVWGRTGISLVQDSSDSPLYFVVHVEDITERKHAEEALRQSEEARDKSYWYIRKLHEVLPFCMGCKKVRSDGASWESLETFLTTNTDFLSHGYCPECLEKWKREIND